MGKKKPDVHEAIPVIQDYAKSHTPEFEFLLKARSSCDQMFLRGRTLAVYLLIHVTLGSQRNTLNACHYPSLFAATD